MMLLLDMALILVVLAMPAGILLMVHKATVLAPLINIIAAISCSIFLIAVSALIITSVIQLFDKR